MQAVPLTPIREKKRIQLKMLAFERSRNGLQAGLLPLATRFAVLEDLITSNNAGIIQLKVPSLCCGPEHEGCVAVASPGDGYGSRR